MECKKKGLRATYGSPNSLGTLLIYRYLLHKIPIFQVLARDEAESVFVAGRIAYIIHIVEFDDARIADLMLNTDASPRVFSIEFEIDAVIRRINLEHILLVVIIFIVRGERSEYVRGVGASSGSELGIIASIIKLMRR